MTDEKLADLIRDYEIQDSLKPSQMENGRVLELLLEIRNHRRKLNTS